MYSHVHLQKFCVFVLLLLSNYVLCVCELYEVLSVQYSENSTCHVLTAPLKSCDPNPCHNGGWCVGDDDGAGFTCICPDGSTAHQCDTGIQAMYPDPSVPFRSVPFRSVPFRSVPFRSVPVRPVPSRPVPSRPVPSRPVTEAVAMVSSCISK